MMHIRKDSGFTILEMMIAMVILGIGAAVAYFSYRIMLPDINLKAAVRDMKSHMNTARLSAVNNNTFVTLQFDIANNTYTMFLDNGAGTAGDFVQDAGEPTIRTVNITNEYPNVTMYQATFSGGNPFFCFDSRGNVNNVGGSVRMTNTNNNFRRVTVSLIGKATIQESTDGGVNWADIN